MVHVVKKACYLKVKKGAAMLEFVKKLLRIVWIIPFMLVLILVYLTVALRFGHKFSNEFVAWALLYFNERVKGVFY